MKYCEAALADRRGHESHLRTRVENAIASLLPHGRVLVEDVARSLGMSERTLARKLSDEGLNFTEILQQLRRDLAVRYLGDRKLHVSKIAWLLGFHEVSAFTINLPFGEITGPPGLADSHTCSISAGSPHLARRIGLRPCNAQNCRQCGSTGGQMQECAAGKFHDVPPWSPGIISCRCPYYEQRQVHRSADKLSGLATDRVMEAWYRPSIA